MLEGFKKWYHRQGVKAAADDSVKGWKWQLYGYHVGVLIFLAIAAYEFVLGRVVGLVPLVLGLVIFFCNEKWNGKVRHMSLDERVILFAGRYGVKPEEVLTKLKEKGKK